MNKKIDKSYPVKFEVLDAIRPDLKDSKGNPIKYSTLNISKRQYSGVEKNIRNSYDSSPPETHDRLVTNLENTRAKTKRSSGGVPAKAGVDIVGTPKDELTTMIDVHKKMAQEKRTGTYVSVKKNLEESWFGQRKFKDGNIEIPPEQVQKIKNETSHLKSSDHDKQAKSHRKYASEVERENGKGSVIAKKQRLLARVHDSLSALKGHGRASITALESVKIPKVNRLYEAYAQVYNAHILDEAGGSSWTSPKGHEVSVKREPFKGWKLSFHKRGAKEPLVKMFQDKDSALRHADMLDNNVNS